MRKTIALVVSIFLAVSLLAGCGGSSAPKVDSPQTPAATQPSSGPSNDAVKESTAPADTGREATTPALAKPTEETKEPTEPISEPSGQLKVHFIDVGQGDAILVQAPSQNILIDSGDRGTTVVNYLNNQGVKSLDLVIGNHPHADHIGGLINVFESIPVKEVIDPGVVHTTKTFEDYLTLIDAIIQNDEGYLQAAVDAIVDIIAAERGFNLSAGGWQKSRKYVRIRSERGDPYVRTT